MRLCFSQTPEDRFSRVEAHFSIACTVYLKKREKITFGNNENQNEIHCTTEPGILSIFALSHVHVA